MPHKIFRLTAVLNQTSLSRSTIYKRIEDGLWTKPIHLGGSRAMGWPEYEVTAIINAYISNKSELQIRELVSNLHSMRTDQG